MEDVLKVKSIEAESITIVSPDSPANFTIRASSGAVGAWLTRPDGSYAGFVCDRNGPPFFVVSTNQSKGFPNIVIAPTEDGDAVFQIRDGDTGSVKRVKLTDLANLVGPDGKE